MTNYIDTQELIVLQNKLYKAMCIFYGTLCKSYWLIEVYQAEIVTEIQKL